MDSDSERNTSFPYVQKYFETVMKSSVEVKLSARANGRYEGITPREYWKQKEKKKNEKVLAWPTHIHSLSSFQHTEIQLFPLPLASSCQPPGASK
jgi:hypothetical protein